MKYLVGLLLVGILTACGSELGTTDPVDSRFERVTTTDGVDCVVYHSYQKGGISCNWERYNEDHP